MRTRLTALALALAAAGPAAAQSPEVIDRVERELTVKRLQGAWVPDLLFTPEGAEPYPLAGRALYFDKDNFVRLEGKKVVAQGTFRAEAGGLLRLTVTAAQPWDLESGGGPAKGEQRYAFKVDGDVLTLCFVAGNKAKAGDLTPGEGRQVVVYRRPPDDKKAAGPAKGPRPG